MELDARRMNMALHLRCRAVFIGVVPYSCARHLVPYVAAVKNPYPVTSFYCNLFAVPSDNVSTMFRVELFYLRSLYSVRQKKSQSVFYGISLY